MLGCNLHQTYTQTDMRKQVKKSTKNRIVETVPFQMGKNCKYGKKEVVDTALFSVTKGVFIEYGSKRLRNGGHEMPSADDVFYHLNKLDEFEVYGAFCAVNNRVLEEAKNAGAFDLPVWAAIDKHKIPWFGKSRDKHALGMERVRGTNWAHGYGSIECVKPANKFTLAAAPLTQYTTKKTMITNLVKDGERFANIEGIFADREFYNVESIAAIEGLGKHYIIPVRRNSKIDQIVREAHRTAEKIPNSYSHAFITDYTMRSGKVSVSFKLVAVLEPPDDPKEPLHEFVFATNLDVNIDNVMKIAESYRSRWGIETGYRVKECVRGKTCSRKYHVRLLLQLLSVLLYNLWTLCNMLICIKTGGGRKRPPLILDEFKDAISDEIYTS